ncbi:MAG: diguanylate cyclase [Myxococcota bacterium]
MTQPELLAELDAVRRRHVESLPGRLAEVEDAYARVPPREDVVRSALHRIVGACGTFGLVSVAESARRAEQAAYADIHNRIIMHEALADLRASVKSAQDELLAEPSPHSVVSAPKRGRKVVFLEPEVQARFAPMLRREGLEVALFEPEVLHGSDNDVGVVISGLAMMEAAEVCPTQDLQTVTAPRPPRIAIIERDHFELRLAAVRAGAHGVLVEPVQLHHVLQLIHEVGRGLRIERPKVLLVDDDLEFARDLQSLLSLEGIDVQVVGQVERVTAALREQRADVIVTDLHMPHCDGFELAAVIRQEASFLSIPIVFLSADQRSTTHRAVMRNQGDAFVAKGDNVDVMVDVIRTKASRARQLEASITRDGLTGLLRHVPFKERLDEELRRSGRQGTGLVCGMVDIDHFKTINDRFGHPVGDIVIRRLARAMARRLRSSDVLGRYGGEEFVFCMPEASLEQATQVIDGLRRAFEKEVFETGDGPFSVTFSAGLAGFPSVNDREQLLHAADEALYRAKQMGRNRVERA